MIIKHIFDAKKKRQYLVNFYFDLYLRAVDL